MSDYDVEYVSSDEEYPDEELIVEPDSRLRVSHQLAMLTIMKRVNPWFLDHRPLYSLSNSIIEEKHLYASILKHTDGRYLLNIRFSSNGQLVMFAIMGVYDVGSNKKSHVLLDFVRSVSPFSFRDICSLLESSSFADVRA
jgi:hypothetical protein